MNEKKNGCFMDFRDQTHRFFIIELMTHEIPPPPPHPNTHTHLAKSNYKLVIHLILFEKQLKVNVPTSTLRQ